jgi:vacuolar protein sorting-associated protein IST1
MAVQRIQLAVNKRSNAVKIQKQKISQLLAEGKDEKARIQVEHIIRDDFTIEGYELLELMCELVHERIRQITTSTTCPQDLKEPVSSLIWAAKNVDIEELKGVAQQLRQKFGKEFSKFAEANENQEVNPRLYSKMVYKPPSSYLVLRYLEEIARAYKVDWTPSASLAVDDAALEHPYASVEGTSIQMAPGSGFANVYAPTLIPDSANLVSAFLLSIPALCSQSNCYLHTLLI